MLQYNFETMETETLKHKAEFLIMRSYEICNGVNCYGYTPMKSNSPDYKRAKKKALLLCKNNKEITEYIKTNL
jgi:hypothetical protein